MERKRREAYKKEHHVPFIRYGIDPINPFAGKIICGQCESAYIKRAKQQYCCTKRRRTGSRECQALDVNLGDVIKYKEGDVVLMTIIPPGIIPEEALPIIKLVVDKVNVLGVQFKLVTE